MTARDDLAERVKAEISHHIDPVIGWLRMDAANGHVDSDQARLNAWRERLDKAADAIADLVKPRTITTAEELDALGAKSVVLDSGGVPWVCDGDPAQPWASVSEDPYGGPIWADSEEIDLPATVLYEGAAS